MASNPKLPLSVEEYLAAERTAEHRSEYYQGDVFAMTGASMRHNVIVANLVGELRTQLKGRPCTVLPSDMRVKVSATGLYTYPDVVVVCDNPRFEDDHRDTLLNPTLLIEVLSKSTEAYDRGKKAGHYRQLESLAEYLLVEAQAPKVEHYRRQPDGQWLLSEASGVDSSLKLPSIECVLLLAEVYEKAEFSES